MRGVSLSTAARTGGLRPRARRLATRSVLQAASYEQARAQFEWAIPERYNIADDCCDRWVRRGRGDQTAIIDYSSHDFRSSSPLSAARREISYRQLQRASNQLANGLTQLGVGRGDRVGVLRPQGAWTAAGHLAAWKLGAVSVPLFSLFGTQALQSRLSSSRAAVVVTDAAGKHKLRALEAACPVHVVVPEEMPLCELPGEFATVRTRAEEPALLIYTSGTTGEPKGALHGHRVLLGHMPGVEMSHSLLPQPGDVLWTPADWAWIGGLLDVLMPALRSGVPVVAARSDKFDGDACKALIAEARIRNVFFPPTALRLMRAAGTSIGGLRTVACGGEPLGEEVLQWGRDSLGVEIAEFYGQTECNMVLSSCPAWFATHPGAIGKSVPGFTVEVINEEGRAVTDEEGDIAVLRGGASMMLEYWENPEATALKFRGKYMLTGDRGTKSAQGFVQFVGRDDDVICSAGYRIGPAEVEDCLLRHPAVASVGVVGKPDPLRTEIVKAYVQLKDGRESRQRESALLKELQEHVKTNLAAHEYPREIEFVDKLPMTITGKIVRKELRERARLDL